MGNVDIVMLLLQHGAQVDATTKDMYTALHIAAKEGQDEVKDLIAKKITDHIDTVYLMQLFWIRHQEFFIWNWLLRFVILYLVLLWYNLCYFHQLLQVLLFLLLSLVLTINKCIYIFSIISVFIYLFYLNS